MVKIKIISNGKLDKVGWKKIRKSFFITIGAAALGWLANSIGMIDYGSAETLAATLLPFIVNFGIKWLGKYESKE